MEFLYLLGVLLLAALWNGVVHPVEHVSHTQIVFESRARMQKRHTVNEWEPPTIMLLLLADAWVLNAHVCVCVCVCAQLLTSRQKAGWLWQMKMKKKKKQKIKKNCRATEGYGLWNVRESFCAMHELNIIHALLSTNTNIYTYNICSSLSIPLIILIPDRRTNDDDDNNDNKARHTFCRWLTTLVTNWLTGGLHHCIAGHVCRATNFSTCYAKPASCIQLQYSLLLATGYVVRPLSLTHTLCALTMWWPLLGVAHSTICIQK